MATVKTAWVVCVLALMCCGVHSSPSSWQTRLRDLKQCRGACCPDPCKHGDCKTEGDRGYMCTCDPGWTGRNCTINKDECCSNPCLKGECTDEDNGYRCECDEGWTGTNCDQPIVSNACESSPCCQGECVNERDGSYRCDCLPGWTGVNCETKEESVERASQLNGRSSAGATYNCADRNPCTPANIAAEKFYFPADNPQEFVQCSELWNQCYVTACAPGTQWHQAVLTCA